MPRWILPALFASIGLGLGCVSPTVLDGFAPSQTLTATPSGITAGESSLLAWTSSGATSCTASGGWTGSQPVNGTLIVTPAATTTYTLACRGAGGTTTQSVTVTVTPPPAPTLAFTALPATITAGATSTLSWTSTNATSCIASGGWTGTQPVSGTLIVSPNATTTFALVCIGAGGTVTQSASVTVNPPPAPTLDLTVLPTTITTGESSTLSWSSTNASSCIASDGWTGSRPVSGTLVVSPTATTTYTLGCTGAGGTVTQSASVTVNAPPVPTLTLTALPATITIGQSSTLSWSSSDATSCAASGGWTGSRPVSGTLIVSPTATTTYTLGCTGAGGTVTQSASVTVNVPPVPTLTLTALPATITTGQSSTLSWNSTNATSCTASGGWTGSRTVSGTLIVSPTATTTYTLACSGAGGTVTQSASVTVNPPPAPTLALTALPTTITTGESSTLSWNSTDATTCTASGGWTGTQPLSGTLIVSPTATTTYTLGCTGAGGTISQSASVTVNPPPPPTLIFSALPTAITTGQSSTLSWSSSNTTSCTASGGWTGTLLPSGTQAVSPTATTTYTLSCTGAGGTIVRSAMVTVTAPPPPSLTFTALPATITFSQSSTLSWSSTNATSCTASNGWTGTQQITGTLVVSPATTTTYTLGCTGAGGTISQSATVTVTAPSAPTLDFSALPTAITTGQSSTLSWSSTNTASCTASGGWTGTQLTSGTLSVSPTITTTYTLACAGPGGLVSQSVTVTVSAPPTLTFTAFPTAITTGQSSTLSWTSSNATSCTASGGWTGTQPLNGTLSVSPTTTTTYTLACAGAGGTVTQSATVTVNLPPPTPTLTFTALPSVITTGQSSTLSWTSSNATSCTASDGWTGPQPTNGTLTVSPTTTTTYTLGCTGAGGTVSQSATVTVNPPPAPTLTFTALPATITAGETSTLSWSGTNATGCTASNGWTGTQPLNGTVIVSPTTTTTYTLACAGPGGTVSQSATVTVNVPPVPTLTFTALPVTITTGESSSLSWTSSNATSCIASGGWTGSEPLSGTLIVSPTTTTTYTLACTGPGGTVTESATVTVNTPPAPTLTFTATPVTITAGESSSLSWTSTNATGCTASDGWTGAQLTSGTLTVSPSITTTYTLTCTGPGGTVSQSATVTVNAPPVPTLTLTALPATIVVGQSSTLSWTSTNATSCTASDGWTGTQLTSGTQDVTPGATTIYTLTCSGAGGTVTQSATVTVNAPAPTLTFTATPLTILVGQSSTLSWTSTNATSCTATDGWTGTQQTSGSLDVTPTTTTTYTLDCTGAGGTVTQSATVTVNTPPVPTLTFTATPATIDSGQASNLSWTSTDATSCTATDGWTGTQLTSGTLAVSPATTTTYTLACTGLGGTITQSATVTVTPPPPGDYVYPLRLGPTNRYLIDQNGKAFLMVGDAAWSLIAQLTDADVETYFATRQAQGFTLTVVNLIEHKFSAAPPRNAYGEAPFTGANFITPNEAYFSHVDTVLRAAASHGIVVMLDVIYLGSSCGDEGWCGEVQAATPEAMTAYGAYLGSRYRDFDNIIWQIGGDANPTPVASKLTALVNGILSADTRHPFTAHNGPTQTAVEPWDNAAWITLNNVYTYSTTLYSNVLTEYNRTPVKPVFLIEAMYENETDWHVTQQQLRAQFYWTLLSGGFGEVYGNCPVWNFDAPGHGTYCPQTGWQAQLSSQGAKNMQFGAALLGARHWWTLVPDAGHQFLTAGFGSGADYATAAYASDGSTALAYLPTSRAVTVTGSLLTGADMTATWYNPATGVSTLLGSFPTAGSQSFTPPAAGDWVLVLDAQGP